MTKYGLAYRIPARHAGARGKAKFDPLGACAEALIVGGVIVGAFFVWKTYIQPDTLGAEQQSAAIEVVQELAIDRTDIEPATVDPSGVPIRPIVESEGHQFAALYIPRLGDDWVRPITASVTTSDLAANIGHYPSSSAPGEMGNFALAGHRTGWGDPFVDLPHMVPGDQLYVETIDGWYVYEYRSGQYIETDAVEVLAPVPMQPDVQAQERFITLQTCNPPWSGGPEYFVGHGVMVDFVDRADGPPNDVAMILEGGD